MNNQIPSLVLALENPEILLGDDNNKITREKIEYFENILKDNTTGYRRKRVPSTYGSIIIIVTVCLPISGGTWKI